METNNLRDLSKTLHALLREARLERLDRKEILDRLSDIVSQLDSFIDYIEARE